MPALPDYIFRVKSAFAPPAEEDGFRVLVERVWPPQLAEDAARIDLWLGDGAPSNKLRKWYERSQDWKEFYWRYEREMDDRGYAITELFQEAANGRITLLYAGDHPDRNHAVALKKYLEGA